MKIYLKKYTKYIYCPVFDNGKGFMLDNIKYPFDIQEQSMIKIFVQSLSTAVLANCLLL